MATTKTKKTAAKPVKAVKAQTFLSLADAKLADDERNIHGVLVDLGTRFQAIGISKVRILSRKAPSMQPIIRELRRDALKRFGEAESRRIWDHEDLPPEVEADLQARIGIRSLVWADDVAFERDFEVSPPDGSQVDTALLRGRMWELMIDGAGPQWVGMGFYQATGLISNEKVISDPAILEAKKKDCAYGLQSLLAEIDTGAKTVLETLRRALSNR